MTAMTSHEIADELVHIGFRPSGSIAAQCRELAPRLGISASHAENSWYAARRTPRTDRSPERPSSEEGLQEGRWVQRGLTLVRVAGCWCGRPELPDDCPACRAWAARTAQRFNQNQRREEGSSDGHV